MKQIYLEQYNRQRKKSDLISVFITVPKQFIFHEAI